MMINSCFHDLTSLGNGRSDVKMLQSQSADECVAADGSIWFFFAIERVISDGIISG